MDDSEKRYEDFISTVSHELRTPLTSIRGFAQTMLNSWDKLDDETKKKFVKIIEEQSNRLIHMTENMLSVTKTGTDKKSLHYTNFSIGNLLNQTLYVLKQQYKNQKFDIKISPENIEIFADKDKFQQVLTNLIENSAKYSKEEYLTFINIRNFENNTIIEISNTGIHIERKDYQKIFTKFSRIDNPLTRQVQGSGLGLYITESLIKKMGGEISVKSEKINNSELAKITFTVKMPIKNIEEQARIQCNQ